MIRIVKGSSHGDSMVRRVLSSAGLLALLLGAGACFAATDGPVLQSCSACHGDDGIATQPQTPHLNAQSAAFITDALAAFASGQRPTAVVAHGAVAADQVAALAKHYAGQNRGGRPRQEDDAELVSRGATIYSDRCSECHLDGGRDSDDGAPLMAGQDKAFLVAQTLLFKSGVRKFPFMMGRAYARLSDEDLIAVATYFAVQDPASAGISKKKRRK